MRDCAPGGPLDVNNDCGDVVEDGYVDLYGTAHECCLAEMSWQDPDLCASLSDPSSPGTNKFYAIQQDMKCAQDCTGSGPCAGPPQDRSARLFDDAADCCREKFPWLSRAQCLAATNGTPTEPGIGGTGEWYVSWELEK